MTKEKTEIAKQPNAAIKAVGGQAVQNFFEKNMGALQERFPDTVAAQRLIGQAVQSINANPKLKECTPASLQMSVLQSLYVGLEVNSPLKQAYLVPYGKECTFMPGYIGLMELARRAGGVDLIYAEIVYENDDFQLHLTPRSMVHNAAPGDRGEIMGAYGYIKRSSGAVDFEYMRLGELEKIRSVSKAPNSPAWRDWAEEMYKKCALRRLLKRQKMSVECQQAREIDDLVSVGKSTDNVIDMPPSLRPQRARSMSIE